MGQKTKDRVTCLETRFRTMSQALRGAIRDTNEELSRLKALVHQGREEFKVGDEVVALDEIPEDGEQYPTFLPDMRGIRGVVQSLDPSSLMDGKGLVKVAREDGKFWYFRKHWLRPAPKAEEEQEFKGGDEVVVTGIVPGPSRPLMGKIVGSCLPDRYLVEVSSLHVVDAEQLTPKGTGVQE